jgi:hypothetical protein
MLEQIMNMTLHAGENFVNFLNKGILEHTNTAMSYMVIKLPFLRPCQPLHFLLWLPSKEPDNARDLQDHNVFKNTLEDELGTFRSRLLYKSLLFPEQ